VFLIKLGLIPQVVNHDPKHFMSMHHISGKFISGCINFTEIMGFTDKEWRDKSPYDYIHPNDIESVLQSHIYTQGGIPKVIYRLRKKGGDYIWLEARSTIIGDKIVTSNRVLSGRIL